MGKYWALEVMSPLAQDLGTSSFSDDMGIHIEYDYSEHETYWLVSPHLNSISGPNESTVAFYRAQTLLLILNSCLRLDGVGRGLLIPGELRYFDESSDLLRHATYSADPIIYIQCLQDPFDRNLERQQISADPKSKTYKLIAKSYSDPLVREVLVLFSLSTPDSIYCLINIYKIYDTIKNDPETKNQENLLEALKPFDNGKNAINRYINTRAASGILARHGATNWAPGKQAHPSMEYVLGCTVTLINTWLDLKMLYS